MTQRVHSAALIRGRIKARRYALQALYQWQMTSQNPKDIFNEFVVKQQANKVDKDYFHTLVMGVTDDVSELNEALTGVVDRPFDQLDPVERAILYIGAFELRHQLEIPWRVAVNEAVELAKMFGAEDAHKYINGVLDKLARVLRTQEIRAIS